MSILSEIQKLPHPNGSKQFLTDVKKILQDFKALSSSISEDDIQSILACLVKLYLTSPSKLAAKRAMSSCFQGLDDILRAKFEDRLCCQLKECLTLEATHDGTGFTTRQCVDNINSLMENFKLGEKCLFKIFTEALRYLVQAERHFLSGYGPDVPPVGLNEIMLNCHVTMQTINLVLQKTASDCPEKLAELVAMPQVTSDLMDLAIQIIHNESFLLDCRCCCAMNVFLMLQLTLPEACATDTIPSLLFPKDVNLNNSSSSTWVWLTEMQAECLVLDAAVPLTFLALTYGYVAMVTAPSLLHKSINHKSSFYIDSLLPKILDKGKSCEDTPSKTLYAKTVNLWTTKLLTVMEQETIGDQLAKKMRGHSQANCDLLDYVWTHWEDQLDIFHQSAKTVFENVLKLHVKASTTTGEDSTPFIFSILANVLAVSWSSRGKFGALTSCAHHIGTIKLLSIRPSLPEEILEQLKENAVSCYASELYSCLFASNQREIISSVPNSNVQKETAAEQSAELDNIKAKPKHIPSKNQQATLMDIWICPVIKAMHSTQRKWKQNIIEYLLPKLMKNDVEVLDFMIEKMSFAKGSQSDINLAYGAIIMCLRRARIVGLLKSKQQTTSNNLWFGILHPSILKAALCSLNEQIRLDAFALLCENCKTSEAISSFEFEMLRLFIPYNVNSQSPAFRQACLALLKKLFFRLKESLGLLNRLVVRKNSSSSLAIVTTYESFLSWLTNFLLDNIYPGSTFARRTTCLACLSLVASFFSSVQDGFSVPEHLTENHVQTFLECISDTYEENKKEALSMLTIYSNSSNSIGGLERLRKLLTISLTLACSTKPQDCVTAAYLLNLLLKQPAIWEVLQDYQLPVSDALKLKLNRVHSTFMPSAIFSRGSSPATTDITKQIPSSLYLLNLLCLYLNDQIEVARRTLVTAAASRPMYPTLHCIRYIMRDFDWNALTESMFPLAKQLIDELIHTCLNLADVVSPVVQNSSPEGNVPADAILSPDLNMSDFLHSLSIKDKHETKTLTPHNSELAQSVILSQTLVEAMPEYLVVCCWRSIKEVSLVLGKLCLQIPIAKIDQNFASNASEPQGSLSSSSSSSSSSSLLSLDQIKLVGEYFTCQLLESIHRGAFELAYAGFQLMCQMLWSHPAPAFHKLPSQWLQQVMGDIRAQDSKLCATRRSAGVPFFVQAITSSEPPATGRRCFHDCIKVLLVFALNQGPVTDDAQVHALNILRTLYRDARLGEEVVPYIAEGLKAAILGFKSDLWSVRNSATLLLSALMTRIFGVKRSKDESAMSRKNCQTGRAFFHRYPSLYPFLLNELESATASVERQDVLHLHPSLYPVLLVLGRLFPSTLEGSDTSLNLSAFIPYVLKCASSPVYKTRIIAARALQPLAKRSQVTEIIVKLLDNLTPSTAICSSLIHGSLLQLRQLMKLVFDSNNTLKEKVVKVFASKFMACCWLLSSHNPCFATQQEALKLVDVVLDVRNLVKSPTEELGENLRCLGTRFTSSLKNSSLEALKWKPFFYELEKTKASLVIKHLIQFKKDELGQNSNVDGILEKEKLNEDFNWQRKMILDLLGSLFYEVRLEALNGLILALDSQSGVSLVKGRDVDTSHSDDETSTDAGQESATDWMEACEDDDHALGKSSSESNALRTTLIVSLFDSILKMAVEQEDHHECVEKVFLLLAAIPDCAVLLRNNGYADYKTVFKALLCRIEKERRTEVKASMLKFSSHIVPLLYESMKSGKENKEEMDDVKQWINIQTTCCRGDACPDVQLSVASSLVDNSSLLLCDPQQKLGTTSLLCWNILVILLQADDLEVKDVAASAVSIACGQHQDAYHPNYALHKLPEFLISFQRKLGFNRLFECFVSWILLAETPDDKDSDERLFERGEMNTNWDQIAFSRSVAEALTQVLKGLKNEASSQFDCRGINKKELEDFITETATKLVQDLRVSSENVVMADALTNPTKYTDVQNALVHAESLIQIFNECQYLDLSLPTVYYELETLIMKLKEKLRICDL